MKKKIFQTTIVVSLVCCTLLSGCGSLSKTNTLEVASSSQSETLPLSEDLKTAQELGIADEHLLSKCQEPCTQLDATRLIATVYELKHDNQSSLYLSDMLKNAKEHKTATRYWIAQAIYYSAMETAFSQSYENYNNWMDYCDANDPGFHWPDAQVIGVRLQDKTIGEGGVWDLCPDQQDASEPADTTDFAFHEDYGDSKIVNYAMLLYDRTNGEKVLSLDANGNFRPQEALTVEQAVLAALRYYNSFEDVPDMVPLSSVTACDSTIITPELLDRKSELPAASCQELPATWHGALFFDIGRVTHQALGGQSDKMIYESDIATLKQNGFNFIGLAFDFSFLQGPVPEDGKINETRLKELDQIIAWCMKYDIHVDLRCSGVGGCDLTTSFDEWNQHNHDTVNGSGSADDFAALWAVLARRYQNISNRDLSFNLLIEPEINSEEQYAAFFTPAVNAIRESTPSRCIIADIHSGGLTGESMGKLGVALSYHLYEPRDFCDVSETTGDMSATEKEAYLKNVQWPYQSPNGTLYDASAAMEDRGFCSVSANELIETAKKYQVGVMIGEWGIFDNVGLDRYRYSDNTLSAYLNDMSSLFKKEGLGWCWGCWYGNTGIMVDYPVVPDTEYAKVDGTAGYVDQKMEELFKEINN